MRLRDDSMPTSDNDCLHRHPSGTSSRLVVWFLVRDGCHDPSGNNVHHIKGLGIFYSNEKDIAAAKMEKLHTFNFGQSAARHVRGGHKEAMLL